MLPLTALVLFLVSLVHGFLKVQSLEERIGNQVTTAMWLIGQAEIEYLRFLGALDDYGDGDNGVTLDDVTQRFEIFWSRVPVLLEGEESRPLRSMLATDPELPLRKLLADLERLDLLVFSLEAGDTPALEEIRTTLQPYGPYLHRLVIETHWQKGWRTNLYLVRDVTLYLGVGPAFAGLLLSGGLLVVFLVREIRRSNKLLDKSQRAETALVDARNFAEKANATKSRFLMAANHDLRQPLQALSFYAASLRRMRDESERKATCDEMSGAIETMGDLLDVLLDIGNLEEGRVEVRRSEFPIAGLFDTLAREFRGQAEGKGIDLRIVPSRMMLRSDPVLLGRIVQNLVANAISYTLEGKVVVGCRKRGGVARIEVWDSGVGIPAGKLSSIFEDYYQVDNPARDRRKGLGLGLAIVQRVADLMGHRIEVRSRLGKGSVFAVEVPLVGRAEGVARPEMASEGDSLWLQGKVLVAIDDDPAILDGVEFLLDYWGARVVCGGTAREALEALYSSRLRPDLVIADYRLPGGDTGLGAVESLRAIFGSHLPAVIITGDTSPAVSSAIEASGCSVVHKPIDSSSLSRLIEAELAEVPDPAAGDESAGPEARSEAPRREPVGALSAVGTEDRDTEGGARRL
jgi:signal transduction histidine kinase/FixJ family two-component response regulator